MPYAPAEFSEAPSAKTLDSAKSDASNNFMKEVQNYQELKHRPNLIGTAETVTGDEAVKKFFNGKEVEKILKDFVINEDPNNGGKKTTIDKLQEQGILKPMQKVDKDDCDLPPKGPKNLREFQPDKNEQQAPVQRGPGSVTIDLNDSKFLRPN